MLRGVAIMESPSRNESRTRPSDGSHLDEYGPIHNVHAQQQFHPNPTPYALEDPLPMIVTNHEIMKSPPASVAGTNVTVTGHQKYRVLGTTSLVAIIYMATAGGPVGSEPLMSTGGPLLGLLGIASYILLCQIPISLMVTELCCAFPENGGFAVWVLTAFGPFWGFQIGYWAWIVSVINNAIYPGNIYQTITNAVGVEAKSGFIAYLIKLAIAAVLVLPSYLGVRLIGKTSLLMISLVIVLTIVYSVWAFAAGENAFFRLRETRTIDGSTEDDDVDWSLLIRTLFWNFDGIHWISMIGGEVRNPAHTYPRVIYSTIAVAVAVYIVPFLASIVANKTPWRDMDEDSYPVIAQAIGGSGLHGIVVFTSLVSLIGLFANSVFLQSFLVQGMAQSQLLPGLLRKRSTRFKTPKYALLVGFLATMVLLGMDFSNLLTMTNAFSCAVQILIVLAMLQLRRAFPYLQRPSRVPGNFWTLVIMLVPCTAVFVLGIASTVFELKIALLSVAFAVPGVVFPTIRKWLAGHRICG